jgi:hypothetical protein
MKKYNLKIIVFVSWALLMVLELIAVRILVPFLGTSLIVWTSLIVMKEDLEKDWANRWGKEIDLSEVDILTDDYAPVDYYVLQML